MIFSPFKKYTFSDRRVVPVSLVFILAAFLFVVWVYYYYIQERKAMVEEKRKEVEAIAVTKMDIISGWQKERIAEVDFFSSTVPFTDYIYQLVNGDTSSTAVFRKNLNAFIKNNGYDEIVLLRPDGTVFFSVTGDTSLMHAYDAGLLDERLGISEVVVQDIFYCRGHGCAHYEWIAPVRDRNDRMIALMVFRINPNKYLFPIVGMWSETVTSGESFIFRFEGDSIRVLTNLKYLDNSEMDFTLPVAEVRKKFSFNNIDSLGFFQGKDYAGNEVMGKVVKVSGTDWMMVVKLDMKDVLSGLNEKLPLIFVTGFAFFLLFSLFFVFILYVRKKRSGELLLKHKNREQEFRRHLAELRSELLSFSAKNDLKKSLSYSVNKIGEVTGSPIGFCHFLENDQNSIMFTIWSNEIYEGSDNFLESRVADNPMNKYGLWLEAVREKNPVVNNSSEGVANKLEVNEEHSVIFRELAVPVIRGEKVLAVLGIRNKEYPYDNDDIYLASYLADILWEIAESKFKEESLRVSEEKYHSLFDEHTAIKILINPDTGKIVDVNRAAVNFYGWSVAEFCEKRIYDIVFRKMSDGITSIYDFLSFKVSQCEMFHLKKDGNRAVVELFSSKVTTESGIYLHAIIHDITSKFYKEKAQEILYKISRNSMEDGDVSSLAEFVREQLSGLLDVDNYYVALHNPIKNTLRKVYMVNQNYIIDEWNIEGSLSGYVFETSLPLLLKKSDRDVFLRENSIDDVPIPPAVWMGAPLVIQGKPAGVVVLKNYNEEGAYDKGALILLEMVAHELSVAIGRSLMINDLMKARNNAQESDRLKSAFIANISHEIKTPLNALLGFIDLLSDSSLSHQERTSYITVIRQSGQRLVKTIGNLLEVSKIQSRKVKVTYSYVSLKEIIAYFKELYFPLAHKKGIELYIDVNEELLEVTISTDKEKLDGILDNLLSNAVKFTMEGKIILNIYSEGNTLYFSINDTGIGMKSEDLEKIFVPFHIANIELTRNHEGTGLGMPIVKILCGGYGRIHLCGF